MPRLAKKIPEVTLIGIDEQTGMIDDAENNSWNVHGRGEVTIYRAGAAELHSTGKTFSLLK